MDGLSITFPSHYCNDCVEQPTTPIFPELRDFLGHRTSRFKITTIPDKLLWFDWVHGKQGFQCSVWERSRQMRMAWSPYDFGRKFLHETSTSLDSLVIIMNKTCYPTHTKHVAWKKNKFSLVSLRFGSFCLYIIIWSTLKNAEISTYQWDAAITIKPNKCGTGFRQQVMRKLFSKAENMVVQYYAMAKHLTDLPPEIT